MEALGVWLEPAECDRGRSKVGEEAKAILQGPDLRDQVLTDPKQTPDGFLQW